MTPLRYPRIASFKTIKAFRDHLLHLGVEFPVDEEVEFGPESPLAQPLFWKSRRIGNRWCILPMEGWDGTEDGRPSDLTERRWIHFGQSGAKLIWGCEAVAVCPEGRSNPNQLWLHSGSQRDFDSLRRKMVRAHAERFGTSEDLVVGLQLTHSGRFSCPHKRDCREPAILYHHPILDSRLGIPPDHAPISDDHVRSIIRHFVNASSMARECGFAFVDIKHCHGYLGHEFLSAYDRPGEFGGAFENRSRFLSEIVSGIKSKAPDLQVAVRLSVFDTLPFRKTSAGPGAPEVFDGPYRYAFGCDPSRPALPDLREPLQFLSLIEGLGIDLVCVTAGSPYYNPHIQRPALFPPSDGYEPPEDPLIGVARMIHLTTELKKRCPNLLFVGSGYTYLQEYLPHVAQAVVRQHRVDFLGLGRMALSYHDLPADILEGRPLQTSRICRTLSDCTTAPRNGLRSGCYPLDPHYKKLPDASLLRAIKNQPR